jgi:DHA2 family multidrug resistance protein
VDPRLVFAAGLTCTALAAVFCAQYSSAWTAENYYRTELLTGVGQSFALIGLVGGIVLQGVFTGGLSKPQWILTFSAFFHPLDCLRNAEPYTWAIFSTREAALESLGLHVSSGNWITDANIHALTAGLFGKSSGLPSAAARAADLIAARLRLQAYSLSLIDGFLLLAWSCAIALVLVGLLRKSPLNYAGLADVQQQLPREAKS